MGYWFEILLVAALGLVAACSGRELAPAPASQNPSPMVEYTRTHDRVIDEHMPGSRFELPDLLSKPVRLYLPDRAKEADTVRLVVHFHGSTYVPERACFESEIPTAIAVVHLGAGSGIYERDFQRPFAFSDLVQSVGDSLSSTGATLRSGIILTAFSAGYGAVRAILENSSVDISAIVLLDGLHTDYIPARLTLFEGGALDTSKLDPFLAFAIEAMLGAKDMLITHSEIFPGTFASTTETTDYLIQELGLSREPVLRWGPVGMQQLSEVRSGRLVILGFAGNTAPDHVDHMHGMPSFLKSLD